MSLHVLSSLTDGGLGRVHLSPHAHPLDVNPPGTQARLCYHRQLLVDMLGLEPLKKDLDGLLDPSNIHIALTQLASPSIAIYRRLYTLDTSRHAFPPNEKHGAHSRTSVLPHHVP